LEGVVVVMEAVVTMLVVAFLVVETVMTTMKAM
jgi:hypothetical protein